MGKTPRGHKIEKLREGLISIDEYHPPENHYFKMEFLENINCVSLGNHLWLRWGNRIINFWRNGLPRDIHFNYIKGAIDILKDAESYEQVKHYENAFTLS